MVQPFCLPLPDLLERSCLICQHVRKNIAPGVQQKRLPAQNTHGQAFVTCLRAQAHISLHRYDTGLVCQKVTVRDNDARHVSLVLTGKGLHL